jgi:hypothetical protein
VVVIDVTSEQPLEMRFVDDNYVVQQFATATSYPSFGDTIGMSIQLRRMAMLRFDVSE